MLERPISKAGWTRVAFGDVVRLSKARVADPEAAGIERVVGLEHIEPGDLSIRRWGDVADGTTFTTLFKPGQVLFGKRRAYQRKVAVADFEGVCSGDIYVLEPANDRLMPELLPFLCQTDAFFDHAVGTSAGSLSPRTNWTSLASFEFLLPPLQEQARIVGTLGALREASEAYFNVSMRMEALNTSLMSEQLLQIEVASKSAAKPIELFGALGQPVLKTGPFGSSLKTSYFIERGVPVITIGSITEHGLDQSDFFFVSESIADRFSEYQCEPGDIVFSRVADVGRCHVIRDEEKGFIISSNLIRIRVDPSKVLPLYLWLTLKYSLSLRRKISAITTQAAGRLLVNTQTMNLLKFAVPDIQIQQELIERFESMKNDRQRIISRRRLVNELSERLLAQSLYGSDQ